MLVITSLDTKDGYSPNWTFECPKCSRPIRFYSIAQKQCSNCLFIFPFTPGSLLKDEAARVDYHEDGLPC